MSGSLLEVTAPQSPVVEVSAADVLNRAADLLEEFGWCQGKIGGKGEGEMCLMGALYEASSDLRYMPFLRVEIHPLLSSVGVPVGTGSKGDGGIAAEAEWNDEPGRTKAEVVAKLRDAAARLDRSVVERATKPADGRVRSGGRT